MDGGSWHCTGDRNQEHPQEKEMQKSKMAVWGGLTNSCEKTGSKKQRVKGKIYPFEYRSTDKPKGTKKILPTQLSVLVANTLVLILSDIYSSIIYTYMYVGCQLFSLNDISMLMDKYLQWFCFYFFGDGVFYIKTFYSFPDSSNYNYRLLKVGTVIS